MKKIRRKNLIQKMYIQRTICQGWEDIVKYYSFSHGDDLEFSYWNTGVLTLKRINDDVYIPSSLTNLNPADNDDPPKFESVMCDAYVNKGSSVSYVRNSMQVQHIYTQRVFQKIHGRRCGTCRATPRSDVVEL